MRSFELVFAVKKLQKKIRERKKLYVRQLFRGRPYMLPFKPLSILCLLLVLYHPIKKIQRKTLYSYEHAKVSKILDEKTKSTYFPSSQVEQIHISYLRFECAMRANTTFFRFGPKNFSRALIVWLVSVSISHST